MTLLLIRHAVTDQTGKRLYGRSPGVRLSEAGRRQAEALAERLRAVPLEAIYASPLERCLDTAGVLVRGRDLRVRRLKGLLEVDYGELTGRSFTELRRLALWRRLHRAPSTVRFPGGETLAEVQTRAVRTVEEIAERHPKGVVAVVAHGDVIRLTLAQMAGIHLDLYQRIAVEPASVSAISFREGVPAITRVNDTGSFDGLVGG